MQISAYRVDKQAKPRVCLSFHLHMRLLFLQNILVFFRSRKYLSRGGNRVAAFCICFVTRYPDLPIPLRNAESKASFPGKPLGIYRTPSFSGGRVALDGKKPGTVKTKCKPIAVDSLVQSFKGLLRLVCRTPSNSETESR